MDCLFHRSEDKFQSVGKWPAFRKPASAESVKYVEDMFGGSEIQCSKCDKHVGTLFHDGKKAGDSHPDAKERHCIESATVNFIVSNPAEIAPQLPQTPSKVTLNVSETLERPTTPPLGAPQNPKSNNKSKLNSSSNKNPLASSAKTPAALQTHLSRRRHAQVRAFPIHRMRFESQCASLGLEKTKPGPDHLPPPPFFFFAGFLGTIPAILCQPRHGEARIGANVGKIE